jgi:hypothetical protein
VPRPAAGAKPPPPAGLAPRPGLEEAAALWWRPEVSERELARKGRRWTMWTAWVAVAFTAPGVVLLLLWGIRSANCSPRRGWSWSGERSACGWWASGAR